MESTLRAVVRRGLFPAAGILFVVAVITWWGSATIAQPPAALSTEQREVPADASVSLGGEGSPAVTPATEVKPSLAELMQAMASYEQAYWPFRMRTIETYHVPPRVSGEILKRYPWGDGRHHEYRVTSEQTSPLNWTRTEVRIADGVAIGTERQVCGPEELQVTFERDRTKTSTAKHGEDPPRYLAVSALLGVFPLQMTRPSDGILLSKYYAEDPSRVTLAWEGAHAKLSFTFGPDAEHSSRYELWLTPIGTWHPFKLRWYLRADDPEFEKEWEVKAFLQTPSTRIRRGTIRCRDREPGVADGRNRPIAYSVDFHVEESAYRTSARLASGAEASEKTFDGSPIAGPASTDPGSVEVVPQVAPLPGPVDSSPPGAMNPVERPVSGIPWGVPFATTIEIESTDADRSEVIKRVFGDLDRSGTTIVAADPLPAFSRTPLMAVIGIRENADPPEIVRLMQTLQRLGVRRFSLSMTQGKTSSVAVVAPADAAWRTVHTLLEEVKKHAGFDVSVRVATSDDPLTPAVPLGELLPSPPPATDPASLGSPPLSPLFPTPPPGTLPPGLVTSPNAIEPPTAGGPTGGAVPSLDAAPPIPPPAALPPPGSIPNLRPRAAGRPPGGELPSLDGPPTSPSPGLPPGGPPFAPPGPGSPAGNDPNFDPHIVDPPRNQPLKVFLLRHASATEAGRIVQQLLGARANLAIDERTNSLLVNGYDDQILKDLEELMTVLDVPSRNSGSGGGLEESSADPAGLPANAPGTRPPGLGEGRSAPNAGRSSKGTPSQPARTGLPPEPTEAPWSHMTPSGWMQKLAPANAGEVPAQTRALLERFFGPLVSELADADSEPRSPSDIPYWNSRVEEAVSRQADQLRQTPLDERDAAKVRELRSLVYLQFHLRQLQQRAELAAFASRLERIGESIETRERIAGKIVDRRVEELLDPALAWKPQTPESPLPVDEMTPRDPNRGPGAPSASNSLLPGGESPVGVGPRRPLRETPVPNEVQSETAFPGFNPFGGTSKQSDRHNDGASTGPSPFQGQGRPSLPTSDMALPSPSPSVNERAWGRLSGTWKVDVMQVELRDALAGYDDRSAEFEIHGNVLDFRFRRQGQEGGYPLHLRSSSATSPPVMEVVEINSDGKSARSRGELRFDGKKLRVCIGRPSLPPAAEFAPGKDVIYFEAHRTAYAATDSLVGTILHRDKDGSVIVGLGPEQGIRPPYILEVFSDKRERLGEIQVTKVLEQDECAARILREEALMPIRIGDRVEKGSQPSFAEPPPQSPQSKGPVKKTSVGVQFDLGNPAGQFLWIEGKGGITTSRMGKTIQTSCGARLRLRISGIPKHAGDNVFLTLEVQDEKSLEASKVIESVATNTIPLRITEEDLEQVFANNLVTKVVYRPHDLTKTGVSLFDTVVSSKLEPGSDPRTEAEKVGTVVAMLRLSRSDESPKTEVRETPSEKPAPIPGLDGEVRAVPDTSQPLRTDAEKAVARIVLVFARDEARRAFPAVLVNAGGKTLAITTGSATIVPDGADHAMDRAFLEIPDRPPVAVKYAPKWQDPKKELYVFECAEELPGQPAEVPPNLDAGEVLSAILPGSRSELRMTPEAARIRAVNQNATWLVPTNKETRAYTGLWELDRALPEGTPVFRGGQLAGVTLLGTRFLGEKADKSYVIPGQRIIEFRAKLGAIASKEGSDLPIVPPASSSQDPVVPEPQ